MNARSETAAATPALNSCAHSHDLRFTPLGPDMRIRPIIDARTPASKHMTDTNQQAVPHGFTQLTEGRIRTTDIILGESGGWAIPHVFLVGGDIGKDGRRIARPHVKKPGSRS